MNRGMPHLLCSCAETEIQNGGRKLASAVKSRFAVLLMTSRTSEPPTTPNDCTLTNRPARAQPLFRWRSDSRCLLRIFNLPLRSNRAVSVRMELMAPPSTYSPRSVIYDEIAAWYCCQEQGNGQSTIARVANGHCYCITATTLLYASQKCCRKQKSC